MRWGEGGGGNEDRRDICSLAFACSLSSGVFFCFVFFCFSSVIVVFLIAMAFFSLVFVSRRCPGCAGMPASTSSCGT